MICPFCSLLCDQAEQWQSCALRASSLQFLSVRKHSTNPDTAPHAASDLVKQATDWLRLSRSIAITGRIYSLQTARAALQFASKWNAMIDGSETGATMDVALATGRSGAITITLAEARDLSDVLFVLGDDSLLSTFPMIVERLKSNRRAPTVILLGQFSSSSIETWKSEFANVWSIPCSLQAIPDAIRTWAIRTQHDDKADSVKPLLDLISSAGYLSFVWAAGCLDVPHRDLWIDRFHEAILELNQHRRAGALGLSGLDAVFQQVCTWTTGFPGRVSFDQSIATYQPIDCDWKRWFRDHANNSNALFVEIDESAKPDSVLRAVDLPHFAGRILSLSSEPRGSLSAPQKTIWLPIAIAGFDSTADMLRADQIVLGRVPKAHDSRDFVTEASRWLEWLVP